eukprot:GHVN01005842.1.p2 GENE.GHVN01005842.1~~GHVN01005842.1.p2  ORF type:complete len:190 (+),score=26.53 GHVN01005842.1:211-780(+)
MVKSRDSTPAKPPPPTSLSVRKKPASHPNTWEMIKDALFTLNDKNKKGASYQSMLSFFERHYFVDVQEKAFRGVFSRVLKDRLERKDLEKVKASYRLSQDIHTETKNELDKIRSTPLRLTRQRSTPARRNSRTVRATSAAARAKNSQTTTKNPTISKATTESKPRGKKVFPEGVRSSARLKGVKANGSL